MEHVNRNIETSSYWKSYEPFLDENRSNMQGKPTLITRGVFSGYSLPVWNSNEEELYFRMRIPFRWDGTTPPWFVSISSLSAAEDIGDRYQFQLDWASSDVGAVVPDTITETVTDEIIVADGSAFYAEIIKFELDPASMVSGQNIQARLRRIAASTSSVTNEIIVFHWCTRWKMNKIGTTEIQGYC